MSDITRLDVPSGVALSRATLRLMESFARKAAVSLPFRRWVATVIPTGRGSVPVSAGEMIQEIDAWVRRNIRYMPDPATAEWVQTPAKTVEFGTGDCDDMATLIAAMALTLGMVPRFVMIGRSPPPAPYEHVYAEIFDNVTNSWVVVDPVGSANPMQFPYFETKPIMS